jgi:hypothetical protein
MSTENAAVRAPFDTVDGSATFFADAFRKFITLRGYIDFATDLVDPSGFVLKQRYPQSLFATFALPLAEDYPRLAANRVNMFSRDLLGLKAWQQILPEYDSLEQYYLQHEFVYSLLEHALLEPAAIRNQVIYSLTTLATVLDASENSLEIPDEDKIKLSTLEAWSSHWPGYESLHKCVLTLNTRAFVNATRNFRNRHAHTLAADFHGIVPIPKVRRDNDGVTTTWAHESALQTDTLLDILTHQHQAAVGLVYEMRSFIRNRLRNYIT